MAHGALARSNESKQVIFMGAEAGGGTPHETPQAPRSFQRTVEKFPLPDRGHFCKNGAARFVSCGMIMTTDPAESSHSIAATRASLLRRIADPNDAKSWTEFYGIYKKLVFGFAMRFGLSRADAEEVTQDVFNEVAQNISKFESNPERGSFRGWLLNLTRWRVMDRARQQQRHDKHRAPRNPEPKPDQTSTIERLPDAGAQEPEEIWEREWELRVIEMAMERLAARVDARHFQVFELYVGQSWSLSRIAKHLEMNPATVYVINHRLKKELKREVERLKERLK
jgi:RNA polymerase sigma-70 factor (ECF subfamily)